MLVSTEAPYAKGFDEKEREGLITHRGCELRFKAVKQTAVGSGWRERRVNWLCYCAFSPGGLVWPGVSTANGSMPFPHPLCYT